MNHGKLFKAALAGGIACTLSLPVFAEDAPVLTIEKTRPSVQLVSNVVFAQVPDRGYMNKALAMDLLLPAGEEAKPAIVVITGGGFINANKDNYIQQRMDFAEAGYAVASITYRVAPTATFPQPVEDVKAAIRYLKQNADRFHIDPDRVGVFGGSAGGYLAAMAGTTSGTTEFDKGENLSVTSDVAAVVDIYGVSDLFTIGADYSEEIQAFHRSPGATEALWVNGSPVFGGTDGGIFADKEKTKAAIPMTYISEKTPPFLIMHGTADIVVSPSQSQRLYDALCEKNIPATLYYVKDAAHGGPYWIQPEIMKLVINFFDEHLKK